MIALTSSGAKFSRCRKWRYHLWRRWADGPVANFLMLNPSTADEVKLDPSCTRARLYAERWGFGALVVTNLFAWRASWPLETGLRTARPKPSLVACAAYERLRRAGASALPAGCPQGRALALAKKRPAADVAAVGP